MTEPTKKITYYDFMGVGCGTTSGSASDSSFNSDDVDTVSSTVEVDSSWPIKKELTSEEVRNDIFYVEKQAFETHILPLMPASKGRRLTTGSVIKTVVKDERCVFFMTQLYMYQDYYALTNFRTETETFIRSRGLVPGQKIWVRWINSYMEIKVVE